MFESSPNYMHAMRLLINEYVQNETNESLQPTTYLSNQMMSLEVCDVTNSVCYTFEVIPIFSFNQFAFVSLVRRFLYSYY